MNVNAWDEIAYTVIGGTPWKPVTLLQAVRKVDRSFPRDKDSMFEGGWSRVPSKCLIEAAYRRVADEDGI